MKILRQENLGNLPKVSELVSDGQDLHPGSQALESVLFFSYRVRKDQQTGKGTERGKNFKSVHKSTEQRKLKSTLLHFVFF